MATDVSGRSCPQCQHPLDQEATTCPNCGQVLSEESASAATSGPTPAVTAPLPFSASDADETLPSTASQEDATLAAPAAEASADEPPADTSATLPADLGSPPAADATPPPSEPKAAPTMGSRRLKIALISAAVLLILAATGGGALYALTRPQPLITVTSDYQAGGVPAGATTTSLHVTGRQFSANSAITFLLDGHPAPDSQIVPSDENGAFDTDVTVTARWKIGAHQLTARDANGYTTKSSVKVAIVHQGKAHTPGPYGSPADDTAHFTLYITIVAQLVVSQTGLPSLDLGSNTMTLTVQGQPDPVGGAVCNLPQDDGKPRSTGGIFELPGGSTISIIYARPGSGSFVFPTKETTAYTCSGAYQGGNISYTETNTVDQIVYSNGVKCNLPGPRVSAQLEGAFNSATTASGTYNVPASALKCSDGSSQKTFAETGTWFAFLFP